MWSGHHCPLLLILLLFLFLFRKPERPRPQVSNPKNQADPLCRVTGRE
jgi:hypothetical protein